MQTLQYKKRLLYSKYDPTRAVLSLVQKNTPVAPGSLILVCSPCLCYGMAELRTAAEQDADIIAVEADEALCEIARQRLAGQAEQPAADGKACQLSLYAGTELDALDAKLRRLAATGKYRRVLRLDFSAGTALAPDFYARVTAAAQDIIASFWKNQITLVRMGRLFAKNLFQNLPRLATDGQLYQLAHSVSLPILVCGAGESLDRTQVPQAGCFTIAVDAALPSLLGRGIRVDAVVSLESQAVIQKAYIGAEAALASCPPLLFADVTSRPSVPRSFPNRTVFFASRYAQATYLDRLQEKGIIHDYIIPLGSVGLAAVLIALRLRKDEGTPVFVTGLDFSYSPGRTHADGSPHDIQRKSSSSRLFPAENYGATFGPAAIPVPSKDGGTMVSIKSMIGYAQAFRSLFSGQAQLFDIGGTGMELGLPHADDAALLASCRQEAALSPSSGPDGQDVLPPGRMREQVGGFLREEEQALKTLKDLLVHGDGSGCRDGKLSLDGQVASLLAGREYLYLHFPDGYRASTDTAFLKRVRAELDFFLKQLALAGSFLDRPGSLLDRSPAGC